MSIYPPLLRHLVFPTFDLTRGTKVMRRMGELERSQHYPLERLEEIQKKRLVAILEHAYNTVPYYHSVFKERGLKPGDIRNTKDLEKLPPLTKDIIKERGAELMSTSSRDAPIRQQTGGSTGEPMGFYVTKHMLSYGSAARYRSWGWAHFRLGEKQAILWGSSFDIKKHKKARSQLKHVLWRRMMMDCFSLTEETLREYAEALARFKPRLLRGYASPMYLLSQYVLEKGIDLEIPIIFSTAENLYDFQRESIEKAFNGEVFDGYGGRETSLVAQECKAHEGYHLSVENVVLETVNEQNEQLKDRTGKFLITDLHNHAMPFIRYDVGDAGEWSEKGCSCGITLPLLKKIHGRVHHFIVTEENNFIPGEFFPHLMKDAKGVHQFQVVQEKQGHIDLFIVKKPGYTEDSILALLKNIDTYGHLDVDIKYVGEIEVPPSGKTLFTISKVPVKFT
ncbi:MAG: phenylacetate--CoA ligase family protein [Thermoplasmata archaeon]|nr:phenylacetate--CoA ligase family protein [Thermoplasmata archaeon]